MPLGRRHESVILVVALMLASAGVAASLAGVDGPSRPIASPTTSTTLAITATSTTTTTTTTAPPRAWPVVQDCTKAEADRPAILTYNIATEPQGEPVSYTQALRMTAAAGIPQANLVRLGPQLWEGYAQASGSVGSLLGPARKLNKARSGGIRISSQLFCAGHKYMGDDLYVVLRAGTDPHAVAARAGFGDVVNEDLTYPSYDKKKFSTTFTTFAPLAVERAIHYLDDDAVLTAQPDPGCVGSAASGAVSVPKALLPTTSTTSSSTTTTVQIVPNAPWYGSLPQAACGIEVD